MMLSMLKFVLYHITCGLYDMGVGFQLQNSRFVLSSKSIDKLFNSGKCALVLIECLSVVK